jgi:hypothetical protein
MMSTQMIYTAIGVWLVIVAAAVGFGVFSWLPMTMGTTALALVVALMPPAILLKLCWGAEPQTVAQLLKGRP